MNWNRIFSTGKTQIRNPYLFFCVLYSVYFCIIFFSEHGGTPVSFSTTVVFLCLTGIMIFCVIRFLGDLSGKRMAEADYGEKYVDVDKTLNDAPLGLQLLSYTRRLRRVAFAYERQRRRLTLFGTVMATASVLVPLVTWSYILKVAFANEKTLPNAWLLVVSSTTAGTLGLAIAVTILKHVKNSQKALSDVQERLLDSIEASMVVNSSDLESEIKKRRFSICYLFCAQRLENRSKKRQTRKMISSYWKPPPIA